MKTNRRSTTLPSPIKTGLQRSTISPSLRYSDGNIGGGDNGSGSSNINNNNSGSSSVNGGKEDTDERLLKVLDNKNKHINSAVKFQIHSFEMFEKYGEHFKNHIRDAAGDCITLSKLYSVYNDTLTNDSEPLIALAKRNAMRFSELFTTIAEVFTDFAREYEKTYLEDMSNLRDTYTITNSTVEPYIEARLSYDDAKRQNVDDIVRGRPQEALVKGQEAQAACLERVRSAEKAYVNGCAAISVESCVMVGDSLVSLAGAFGHLWDKVAEVRPRIEALRDTAAEDRKSVSSADTHNAYPQYIDIAEGLYDSEERYLSTLTVIDSFKQRITGAEALKITHSESETMFLNLGNISNNQSDLCRMLKRVMDTAGNETLGRDLALAVGTKLRALEDAYLPYIENYALAEYYLDAVRKKKAGAAQIRSFEKTCAESDINPFLVSKMLEEPCHHMSSTYNHLKGILAKTSRDAPAWQQINGVVTMMEGTLKKFSEASKDSDYTKEIMKLDDKIEDVESLVEGSRELLKYDTVLLDRIDNASKKEKEKDKDGSIGLSARQEYGMFLFNDILVLTNAKNRIAAKLPNHLMSIVKIGPNEKRQRFRFRLETVTAGSLVFAVGSEKAYEEWVEALPKAFVARRRSQFFGVHLKDIMSRAEESANLAPYVVQLVMSYIRHNGIGSEGVFRISGKATAVARLRNKINAGKIIYFSDVSVCTTLLKMWLRELPVPLLTFDLYDRWTAAGEDAAKLRGCVNDLPECNQCLLYALMKLCKEIADHSDVNKMRADNLGIVIAPNILYERNAQADPLRCTKTNGVVSEIINNFDSVFADFVAKHTDKIDHYNKFMEHPQDSILMISAYEDTSAPASSPSAAAAALNEKVTTTDSKSCADSVTAASSSSTPEPIRDVQIPRMVFPTPQGTEVPFNPYAKAIAGASYAATAAVAAVSSLVAQGGIQALLSSTTTSGSSPASSLLSSSSPSSSSPITSTNTGPSLSATIGAPSPSPTVTAISSPSYVYHKHLHQPPPPPPTTAATAAITSAKGAEGSSSEMSSSSSSLSRESSLIFRRRTGHKRRGSTTSESSAAAATSMAGASQSDTMSGHSEVRSARSMSYSIAGLKFGKGKKEAKSTSRTSLCQRIKSRSDDGCAGLVAADENSPGVVCCATQDNGEDPKLVISAVDTANDSCVTPKSGLEESVSVVVDESDEIGVTEDDRSSSNNNNSSSSSKKKSSKGHRIKKSLEDEDVSVTAVNNTTINTTHQQQQQEESTPEETPRDDKKEKKKRKRKRSDSEVAGSGTDA